MNFIIWIEPNVLDVFDYKKEKFVKSLKFHIKTKNVGVHLFFILFYSKKNF